MHDNERELTFPLEVDDPLVNWLQKVILYCVKALAVFMTLVIIWTTGEVAVMFYRNLITPSFEIIDLDNTLTVLGVFLLVLICIEVFLNIILYLKKQAGHLQLVLATALMAIARKVIILDFDHLDTSHLYGIACVIVTLAIAYWAVQQRRIGNF
jgi:uncharacterized membrane protein (DUF373 family)